MKNFSLKPVKMLAIASLLLFSYTCEKEMPDPPVGQNPTTGGGTGAKDCNTGYKGPTGDIQSDAFCQAAWNYRCYGQTAQADANCKIYKQLQRDNPGMPNCPYCP